MKQPKLFWSITDTTMKTNSRALFLLALILICSIGYLFSENTPTSKTDTATVSSKTSEELKALMFIVKEVVISKITSGGTIGSVVISPQYPLIVQANVNETPVFPDSTQFTTFKTMPGLIVKVWKNATIEYKDFSLGMSLPGSATDGTWTTLSSVQGYISKGSIVFKGYLMINGKIGYLHSGKITYNDNSWATIVDNDTEWFWDNNVYKYQNNNWTSQGSVSEYLARIKK